MSILFRTSALACMLFGAFTVTYAQKFSTGFKAGALISRAHFGDADDNENFSHKFTPGFGVHGLISFPLKKNYAFQSELGYAMRGRKILFNNDTWENKATYHFVDAAMLLRKCFHFQLGKNIPADWFFNIGPHISYWLGGSGEVSAGGAYSYDVAYKAMPAEPGEPDFDIMYLINTNRWLFGLDLGVGFIAPLRNTQKLTTELRFTSGHTFYGDRNSAANRTLGFEDNLRSNEKILSLSVAYTVDVDLRERKKGHSTKDREVKRKPMKKPKRR
jgi:hypothetical protein